MSGHIPEAGCHVALVICRTEQVLFTHAVKPVELKYNRVYGAGFGNAVKPVEHNGSRTIV